MLVYFSSPNNVYVFYAPDFEEVEGAYWFGHVRPSVRLSVHNTFWQLKNSRTAYARILKFYMWYVHEKSADPYFFSSAGLGRVAQSVARLTHEPEVPGSILGPATYFRFSFR